MKQEIELMSRDVELLITCAKRMRELYDLGKAKLEEVQEAEAIAWLAWAKLELARLKQAKLEERRAKRKEREVKIVKPAVEEKEIGFFEPDEDNEWLEYLGQDEEGNGIYKVKG